MAVKALALFSGGLDSILAAKIMMDQGVQVIGINFITEFLSSDIGGFKERIKESSAQIGLKVEFIDITDEFIEMMKDPAYGFGAYVNPCIDCKILMLTKARKLLEPRGAAFVITGEVLGERPMSQRREALNSIENRSGLKGYLLRPLSAKLMPPTHAETEGLIKRENLLEIEGRSRKPQLELAKKYGIERHFTPAGGCLLTDPGYSRRFKDMLAYHEMNKDNAVILKYGRHFRLDEKTRMIVGRDEKDNDALERCVKPGDVMMMVVDIPGPLGVLRGDASDKNLELAASLVASHSKAKDAPLAKVEYWRVGKDREIIEVVPAGREKIDSMRI